MEEADLSLKMFKEIREKWGKVLPYANHKRFEYIDTASLEIPTFKTIKIKIGKIEPMEFEPID